MIIANNTVVLCHYTLREGTETGPLIESTEGGEPLGYIHGIGMMIPLFETNLAGKQAGDEFSFGIKAADAYGEYNENAAEEIPKAAFNFVEGQVLPLEDQDGNQMQGIITQVSAETIVVDFNHPMAGVDLHFVGHVQGVRAATQLEITHGHVHGEGGVTH
jgi:FKBP-type peptidyl-prolyl cis-trans isomerase SlyD